MKKIILSILFIGAIAFTPEKKYKFEFNETELNAIWNCIDQSNAPHAQVKAVQEIIAKQLPDSLRQKK